MHLLVPYEAWTYAPSELPTFALEYTLHFRNNCWLNDCVANFIFYFLFIIYFYNVLVQPLKIC